MAEKKPTYARGKNPNSLANLKRGNDSPYNDRKKASDAGKKSVEIQRTKRTMRELAETIGQEEQTFTLKDGSVVTMSRLEMIMRNFFKECVSNPNHKNVLALAKLRGEDEQHITVETDSNNKYADVEITKEMLIRAEAIFMARQSN